MVSTHEAWGNAINILSLISHCQSWKVILCLLSLDSKKAFNCLYWVFLITPLGQIGLPPKLELKIMALYSCPTAGFRVIVYFRTLSIYLMGPAKDVLSRR